MMISAASAAAAAAAATSTPPSTLPVTTSVSSVTPGASAQRKRQRLDQLVDRIAHFVSTTTGLSSSSSDSATPSPSSGVSSDKSDRSDRSECGEAVPMAQTPTSAYGGHLMSRLRLQRACAAANQQRHQVFNFEHVTADVADDVEDGEVFSPGLTAHFSDRLTLSPFSGSSSVDSPGAISFSPLSFDDDHHHQHHHAAQHQHHVAQASASPLNLSIIQRPDQRRPGCSASSPLAATPATAGAATSTTTPQPAALSADAAHASDADRRRRARSDSDLCDSAICLDYSVPTTPAAWVVTPALTFGQLTPGDFPTTFTNESFPSQFCGVDEIEL